MEISTIGIDIGKNHFHVVGFEARGGSCSGDSALASK